MASAWRVFRAHDVANLLQINPCVGAAASGGKMLGGAERHFLVGHVCRAREPISGAPSFVGMARPVETAAALGPPSALSGSSASSFAAPENWRVNNCDGLLFKLI